MCDASDFAMGAVLGQRKEKIFRTIYYASRTFNEALSKQGGRNGRAPAGYLERRRTKTASPAKDTKLRS